MNKNLIVFSYDFPPSNGGIARLCQEIAVGMQDYYEKVIVLTRKKSGINNPYNSDFVNIVELSQKRILCELEAIKFLRNVKNKERYTILCGIWHPEAIISLIAGFKDVYVLGHGTEFLAGTSEFKRKIWFPFYAKNILQKCKLIINNSHYTESLVKGINKKIATVSLPLGVNDKHFKFSEQKTEVLKFKICTVSRIEKFKGHDFIASVIAKLPKEIKANIEWNIAGTGPDLEYVKAVVNQNGLNKIVKFHGFVPDEALPDFYASNNLFVLCSRESEQFTTVEGFGLVFLEAQSCGLPVIGTRTGGIADAIEEGNGGWLINQDDQVELKKLLEHLYLNRSQVKDMGLKARSRVENFATWANYCYKLFNYLNP